MLHAFIAKLLHVRPGVSLHGQTWNRLAP